MIGIWQSISTHSTSLRARSQVVNLTGGPYKKCLRKMEA